MPCDTNNSVVLDPHSSSPLTLMGIEDDDNDDDNSRDADDAGDAGCCGIYRK